MEFDCIFNEKKYDIKFAFVAYHQGGLKEILDTEKPITPTLAKKLIDCGIYEFYAFDYRLGGNRYILSDYPSSYGLPTWLNTYPVLPNHKKKSS